MIYTRIFLFFALSLLFTNTDLFCQNQDSISVLGADSSYAQYVNLVETKQGLNEIELKVAFDKKTYKLAYDIVKIQRDIKYIDAFYRNTKKESISYRFLKSLINFINEQNYRLEEIKSNLSKHSESIMKYDAFLNAKRKVFLKLEKNDSDTLQAQYKDVVDQISKTNSQLSPLIQQYLISYKNFVQTEFLCFKIKEELQSTLMSYNRNLFNIHDDTYKGINTHSIKESFVQSSLISKKLLSAYLKDKSIQISLSIMILIVMFFSYFKNKKKAIISKINNNQGTVLTSVFSLLFIASVIIPYFFDNPPMIFVELFMTISGVILSILVFKNKKGDFYRYKYVWISLFIIFRCLAVINLMVLPFNYERIVWVTLNLLSCIISVLFIMLGYHDLNPKIRKGIKVSFSLFFAISLISFLLNVFGLYAFSRLVTIGSVISIYTLVIFYFFYSYISLIVKACFAKIKDVLPDYFDHEIDNIQRIALFLLNAFIGISLFLIFSHSFSIEFLLVDVLEDIFSKEIQINDVSFTLKGFLTIILVLVATYSVSRFVGFYSDYISNIKTQRNFSYKLIVKLIFLFFGFYLIVTFLGLNQSNLSVLIGAIGFGIGFGLQNIIANFMAGVMLVLDGKVNIEDHVEIDNNIGVVKDISVRSVRLYASDGSDILVPNTKFLQENLKNWTLSNAQRRMEIILLLDYSSDLELAQSLLNEILLKNKEEETVNMPVVNLLGMDQGGFKLGCYLWVTDSSNLSTIKNHVILDVNKSFHNHKIKFLLKHEIF